VSVQVFQNLGHRAPLLAEGLLKAPTEYWKVWTLLRPGLVAYDESSPVFEALVFCLTRLGQSMREVDEAALQMIFLEMVVPQLSEILVSSAGKREYLCDLMLAYVPLSSHLTLLRALKTHIPDLAVYMLCLSHTCRADELHNMLDEYLLDLYVYYGMIALTHSAPKVRVAGLVILSNLVEAGQVAAVWNLIPELHLLKNDPWWEVQAQLMVLCANMVRAGKPLEADGEDVLVGVLESVFRPSQSKNILQVGLVAIVRCLREAPQLCGTYVKVLLSQPKALRTRLLHPGEGKIAYVMGPTSRLYEERGVADQMPKLLIAQAVLALVEEKGQTRLEVEECELLCVCCENFQEDDVEGWIDFYAGFKLFLVVGLVDPALHIMAKRMFSGFMSTSFAPSITEETIEPLTKAIRMLYSPKLDRAVVDIDEINSYLKSFMEMGELQDKVVRDMLEFYRVNFPDEFIKTNLSKFFS